MKKIHFSIVTPTYNRASSGYLASNIRAISSQKKGDFTYEHILVNDGSTDGTYEFIKKLAKKDKRLKYVYQENSGPAKAVQRGIDFAKGDYIIILDDDDMLTPGSLKDRADFIRDNEDVDWFYGNAQWIDEYGLPTRELYNSKPLKDHPYERLLINNYINSGTPTVKAGLLRKMNWPNWLTRSQDYYLWLELMRPEAKNKVAYLDKILIYYRSHSNNYSAGIEGDSKKQEKRELNFKIKLLHPEPMAFLAEETSLWLEEAHQTNDYWKTQVKPLYNEVTELSEALLDYRSSKVIGRVIRLREKKHRYSKRLVRIKDKLQIEGDILLSRLGLMKLVGRYDSSQKVEVKADSVTPLVSIITPFFNRQDTEPETIRSVLGQTFQNFECIIVNDGSTEKTSKKYLELVKHEKIQVIHQENSGVAAARNKGIEVAKGKYILCLDSDDMIEPTYLEKAVTIMETQPEVSIVTYNTKMFGEKTEDYTYPEFNPLTILEDNMIQTAAVFRKRAWEVCGGYKSDIGYEDWEFWINLVEHGFFAKHIPETLFHYRTAEMSRFVDDRENHHENMTKIKQLHPDFKKNVRRVIAEKSLSNSRHHLLPDLLKDVNNYKVEKNDKPNVLMSIPWMTFGGAETLISTFAKGLSSEFNITFITNLKSRNEWEYKFKDITENIYHLANLFESDKQYLEFISNYITTRGIEMIHVVHSSYIFKFLPELKKRHPNIKVLVTVFNDRAHFNESVLYNEYVDRYSSDNTLVAEKYYKTLPDSANKREIAVIPNGIDAVNTFNPSLYNRDKLRSKLNLKKNDLAVFYIGRLSEEKNPEVFLDVAKKFHNVKHEKSVKFFVVGDGPEKRTIERRIAEERIKNTKYLGYQADIAKFLSPADIFVLPSAIEGFPLSLPEAMAMNTISIVSRVGAVPEIISEAKTGFIVKPGSAEEIAKTITTIMNDDSMHKAIGTKARKEVLENYSSEILKRRYTELYRETLNER